MILTKDTFLCLKQLDVLNTSKYVCIEPKWKILFLNIRCCKIIVLNHCIESTLGMCIYNTPCMTHTNKEKT